MLTENIAAENPASRAETNRRNALNSTGPRTPGGKARVRLNALQHGMYSTDVVLPNEDRAEYDALAADLRSRYSPRTAEHEEKLRTLIDSRWRVTRIVAMETKMFFLSSTEQFDSMEAQFGPDDPAILNSFAQAAGYRENSRIFDQLNRHEVRLRKLINQTVQELGSIAAPATSAQPLGAAKPPVVQPILPVEQPIDEEVSFVPDAVPSLEKESNPEGGFVPAISVAEPETSPAAAAPNSQPRLKMPKFSGPQAKKDRKNWLRKHKHLLQGNA